MTGQAVKPLPSFFAEPERAEFLSLRAANAALREQLDTMRSLAFRDQLTGLFSRHYLTDYLEERIREDSNETNIVLALCDIDDFKTINDARGHQSGDIAIVCIADILDDLAGNHPVIRWGGEELLVVLFSAGLGLALSALAVFFRDVCHLWSVVITAWTYATPLFYPVVVLPDWMMPIMELNPMYHYVSYFRQLLLDGTVPGLQENLICLGMAVVTFAVGLLIFKKSEKKFILYV